MASKSMGTKLACSKTRETRRRMLGLAVWIQSGRLERRTEGLSLAGRGVEEDNQDKCADQGWVAVHSRAVKTASAPARNPAKKSKAIIFFIPDFQPLVDAKQKYREDRENFQGSLACLLSSFGAEICSFQGATDFSPCFLRGLLWKYFFRPGLFFYYQLCCS